MSKWLIYVCLAFSVLLSDGINAQQYSFVAYSVEEGLSQSQVFVLSGDEDGYLWAGTAGGVSRFDGQDFKSYSTESGLLDNSVKDIKAFEGAVWVSSQFGMTRIRGKEVKTWDLKELVGEGGITSFVFDAKGYLWIAIKYKGVFRVEYQNGELDLGEVQRFSLNEENNITKLFLDNRDILWVGGKDIFGFIKDDKWSISPQLERENFVVTDVLQLSNGRILVATVNKGIFALENGLFTPWLTQYLPKRINKILQDSQGKIWVASYVGTYIVDKDNKVNVLTIDNGLPTNRIRSLAEDKEGNIWLGTDGEGIVRFITDELVYFSVKDGLNSNYVMSVTELNNGDIYFSTYGGGVNRYNNDSVVDWEFNKDLPNKVVWSIKADTLDNTLWLGTTSGLVLSRDGKGLEVFKNVSWLSSNKILYLYQNKKGKWIGTSRGLTFVSLKNEERIFAYPNNFPAKNVRSIEEVNDTLWVGTSSGVFVLNDSVFYPFKKNALLKSKIVYCLKETDNKGALIGTANGLYYYNNDSLLRIPLHESFSANNINFIGKENDSIYWVGSNFGVFELNLNRFLRNEKSFKHHYTSNDGLPGIETNLNAFYKDKFNRIWMGTSRGVVRFTRKHNQYKPILPVIKIEDVRLFLKETDWSKYSDSVDKYSGLPVHLELGYRKNYLTFYYKAISISGSSEIKYSVMLKGVDENWSSPSSQTYITYTNLPYGEYTFMVRASIRENQWSSPASFSFVIKKPYYLTVWFLTLMAVLLILVAYIIWKWRSKVVKRKELTQKLYYKNKLLALEQQSLNASMNRHFIFNSLNSIQFYINSNDRLSANKYLTNFAKLIRKNLDTSINGTNLVPLSDELERLELYLSLENMRFQNKFEYKITVEKGVDTDELDVPPMFLQPFVENSIWHGILPKKEKGKIEITIKKEENSYVFILSDNGLGIEESLSNKKESTHSSKGMMITTGRLEILKKTNNQDFIIKGPYQVEKDGKILGTEVRIYFTPFED